MDDHSCDLTTGQRVEETGGNGSRDEWCVDGWIVRLGTDIIDDLLLFILPSQNEEEEEVEPHHSSRGLIPDIPTSRPDCLQMLIN